MRTRKAGHAVVAALIILASAAPAHGASLLGAPYDSADTSPTCGLAAAVAGPEHCRVTLSGDAATGAVGGDLTLISPAGGRAPWSAVAIGLAQVHATYEVTAPVSELTVTVGFHIVSASATLKGLPTWVGNYVDTSGASLLGHGVSTGITAGGHEDTCASCSGGASEPIVGTTYPETVSATGTDRQLTFTLRNAQGDIPVGTVTIDAGVDVQSWQSHSWGADGAHVEAEVTGISVA